MKFGTIAVTAAEGSILAHTIRGGDKTFKKGRTLSAEDIAELAAAGIDEVVAATLEPGDVHEDVAAARVARALCGAHTASAEPFTGRANLYAEGTGLLMLDADRLRQINRLDECLTIATLPAVEQVSERQLLATVKIIPFAVPEETVAAAVAIAEGGGPPVSVAAFARDRVNLVLSRLPQTKKSVLEKTVAVIGERLQRCGAEIAELRQCGHSEDELAEAIGRLKDPALPLLLFGASAIVDREDVVPAGLRRAGGKVRHLGMPVDPGNLLMLGALGDTPVIGVPSCARSPKLNGFDWVLKRVLADVPVAGEDLMDMGVGGLLKEIPSRPRPREKTESSAETRKVPRVAAVILAAGRSTRMGPENKLLKQIDGVPVVRRTVSQFADAGVKRIIVVHGHQGAEVRAALQGLNVSFVENPSYREGLSTSVKQGVSAMTEEDDAAIIALGDMPFIAPAIIDKLISAYDPAEGRGICIPTFEGKRGNPVLWGAAYFEAMRELGGDTGAKHLLSEYSEDVCEVAVNDRSILLDLDTPEAFAQLPGSEG